MSYKPPLAVAFTVAKGMEYLSEAKKPLEKKDPLIKLAKKLLKRTPMSLKAVRELHETNKKHKTGPAKYLAGGDTARRWTRKILIEEGEL